MKNASTGKTSPTEMVDDPDSPSTRVSDWEGAVLKQGGVVVGRARTRGPNRGPLKEQVAVRYSPDVLAAFRATGAGWQTRMNEALRDWLRTHSPVSFKRLPTRSSEDTEKSVHVRINRYNPNPKSL